MVASTLPKNKRNSLSWVFTQDSEFRSFFGRIEDIKNYLTGFDYISAKIPTETRFLEKIWYICLTLILSSNMKVGQIQKWPNNPNIEVHRRDTNPIWKSK